MKEPFVVSHYGVHWDPESQLAFLHQGRGSTNAFGYREKSPFQVRLPNRSKHCNHQVPVSAPVPNDTHWDYFLRIAKDPVVQAMLPIPKIEPSAAYLQDEEGKLNLHLIALSRLSSPIYSCVLPMWRVNRNMVMNELMQTNIQPYVILGCETKHSQVIQDLSALSVSMPRKLVMSGRSSVILSPNVKRITSTVLSQLDIEEFSAFPWEVIGSTILRKYMREEFPKDGNDDNISAKAIAPRRSDS